jgi:hypothetical protein
MKKIISLLLLIICMQYANANNIEVSNVSIINAGAGAQYVKFDVKWDNSWRVNTGPANYDGAYVFFKYKTATGGWIHVNCKTNQPSPLNVIPAGFEIGTRGTGLFVYRNNSNIGVGNVNIVNVQVGVLAITGGDLPYNIDIRAYAIEMVYIPAAQNLVSAVAFGDGDGTNESLYAIHSPNTNSYSYADASIGGFSTFNVDAGVDDITVATPSYFALTGGNNSNGFFTQIGSYIFFPTLGKMWCMKYEITQGAYRDFLNTLYSSQQAARTANAPTSPIGTGALTTSSNYRNYVEISIPSTSPAVAAVYGCDASGNNVYDEPNDGEFVACNYLSWLDISAWLDWSGLMPMTEIQFERICRGHTSSLASNPSILGEYAWGGSTINTVPGTIANPFTATEIISNSSAIVGNANNNQLGTNGPLRNGIFATATSNRITSGASFFGVMDMSGNLSEATVTFGNLAGRTFCKLDYFFGDGQVGISGNASVNYWPGTSSANNLESVANVDCFYNTGTKNRGGDFLGANNLLQVSDRSDGPVPLTRTPNQGGRGVFTVPPNFVIL